MSSHTAKIRRGSRVKSKQYQTPITWKADALYSVQSLKESIKLTARFIKQRGVKKFNYNLPIEINSDLTPETWKFKKI